MTSRAPSTDLLSASAADLPPAVAAALASPGAGVRGG